MNLFWLVCALFALAAYLFGRKQPFGLKMFSYLVGIAFLAAAIDAAWKSWLFWVIVAVIATIKLGLWYRKYRKEQRKKARERAVQETIIGDRQRHTAQPRHRR